VDQVVGTSSSADGLDDALGDGDQAAQPPRANVRASDSAVIAPGGKGVAKRIKGILPIYMAL